MKQQCFKLMAALAPVAIIAALAAPAQAGEITGFGGISGEGYIFADITEGVAEPGIKAVTEDVNNDDFTSENGFAPKDVVNCLMANRTSEFLCDAEPGTGKRVKTNVTGADGFDMRFLTGDTSGITEYFTYGKVTNWTGARLMGLSLQLGTGTGDDFEVVTGDTGVLFDALSELSDKAALWGGLGGEETGQNPLQRAFFTDGLFGDGGQEGETGFFGSESAGFVFIQSEDGTTINATSVFGEDHLAIFGDGMLDRTQIPDGYFFDDDGEADTEAVLLAWFDNRADGGEGAWVYGDGVDGFSPGEFVEGSVLAAWEADAAYEIVGVEDASNLNLNFSMDVGDIELGEFTLRLTPVFAPIVTAAGSDYQFAVAANLDGANIPYLDADEWYVGVIEDVMSQGTLAEQQNAIEQVGYSFYGAYGESAIGLFRGQNSAVDQRQQNLMHGLGSSSGLAMSSTDILDEETLVGEDMAVILSSRSGDLDFGVGGNSGMFLSGSVGSSTFGDTLNSTGYGLTDYTLTAGLDTGFGGIHTVGVAAGYGVSEATINDDRGSLTTTSMGAMLYASADLGDGAYVNAKLGAYAVDYASVRNVALTEETYLGETTGTQMVAGISGGKTFDMQGWNIGPVASAYFVSNDVTGFTETEGNPLGAISVEDYQVESTWMSIGLTASKAFETDSSAIIPSFNIAYVNETTDASVLTTAFEDLPAYGTPIDGRGGQYVNVGVGFTYVVDRNDAGSTSFGVGYDGNFADTYDAHRVILNANVAF